MYHQHFKLIRSVEPEKLISKNFVSIYFCVQGNYTYYLWAKYIVVRKKLQNFDLQKSGIFCCPCEKSGLNRTGSQQ